LHVTTTSNAVLAIVIRKWVRNNTDVTYPNETLIIQYRRLGEEAQLEFYPLRVGPSQRLPVEIPRDSDSTGTSRVQFNSPSRPSITMTSF
jgi:hypothetical protein